MNSKALYWIALGVFALGLHSEYQKGNLPLVRCVADRASAALGQAATRAEQTWALARVLTGHQEFRVADDQFVAVQQSEIDRVMAQHQADLARAMAMREADMNRLQEKLDRMHMVLDRAQSSKLRVLERTRFQLSRVGNRTFICPHTGRRVTVNAPDVSVDPAVEVSGVDLHIDESQ
jgi:hypothetical protein